MRNRINNSVVAIAIAAALGAANIAVADTITYGKIHLSAGRTTSEEATGDITSTQVKSHASRFGIKSEKVLDNGMTVTGQLEYEVDSVGDSTKSSTDLIKARNSYFGLKGGFGEVRAGIHDLPAHGEDILRIVGDIVVRRLPDQPAVQRVWHSRNRKRRRGDEGGGGRLQRLWGGGWRFGGGPSRPRGGRWAGSRRERGLRGPRGRGHEQALDAVDGPGQRGTSHERERQSRESRGESPGGCQRQNQKRLNDGWSTARLAGLVHFCILLPRRDTHKRRGRRSAPQVSDCATVWHA